MVVGGLGGRIIGHLVQWVVLRFPTWPIFGNCAAHVTGRSCITPGVYALIAAGSTMCGVTRLSVTLAIILFEWVGDRTRRAGRAGRARGHGAGRRSGMVKLLRGGAPHCG